jgi:selenide, water dikinase
VLRFLPAPVDDNLLVGASTSDDASVYRLSQELAVVATVDYITPVVDDPYTFGAIAAANSLSDVYAMGAAPLFALSLVNFPRDNLPFSVLEEIVRGGAEKAAEAGISIIGGHSVDDPGPKFGLAVFGTVHPDRVVRNVGARIGDRLALTKPLGSGILLTAFKNDLLKAADIQEVVQEMLKLNRAASEAMVEVGVSAATDVTGFGLLGHLSEMVAGSHVGARLDAEAIPVLDGVVALAEKDIAPSGSRRNLDAVAGTMEWFHDAPQAFRLALADAQTSGGLLIAVAPERADALSNALRTRKVPLWWIGEISDRRNVISVG